MAVTREQVIDYLSALSPDRLHDLILELEDVWGIERPAEPGVPAWVIVGEPLTDIWTVVMREVGPDRVAVIKALRDLLGLSLIDVKRFVDAVPAVVREDIPRREADELVERLTAVGAIVEVR